MEFDRCFMACGFGELFLPNYFALLSSIYLDGLLHSFHFILLNLYSQLKILCLFVLFSNGLIQF